MAGIILGVDNKNNMVEIAADPITRGIETISTDHAGIHKGYGYSISGIFASLAAAATVNYAFKTPASEKVIHLKYKEIQATANKIRVDLYEAPTNAPTLGTDVAAINRARIGTPVVTKMQAVKSGMTIDLTGATVIEITQFVGGSARSTDIEFVLKPDTWYIRTFTNGTGAQADISFFEFWYEE